MTTPDLRQDQRMDEIMAVLLRSGVSLAAGLVLIGGIVYLSRHDLPAINYRVFQGEPQELRTVSGILREAATVHGRGLIQLGLLVLIATPVARVLFSVVAFLYERDWTYVAITVIVLALLCYSLFGGGGL
ncbi:MAG TPA: DUF1634 domain-containing protein [Verrucomicrobiae bacterium]|nr:DUF1634 domain-containing protein [Verrucomicrobiae bacterium]